MTDIKRAPSLRLSGSAAEIAAIDQLSFDYSGLDPETRIVVQQQTREIRDRVRRAAQDIVEVGERLIEVKDRLNHGQFSGWLQAEFDWSEGHARKIMQVARAFAAQNDQIDRFAPSALYLLAAPSASDDARAEALARAEAGERIGVTEAKAIVQAHKPASKTEFTDLEIAASIRSCLLRLDAHGAEPLLDGLRDKGLRTAWQNAIWRVSAIADLVAGRDYAAATARARDIHDPELSTALAVRYAELAVAAVDERIAAADEPPASTLDALVEQYEAIEARGATPSDRAALARISEEADALGAVALGTAAAELAVAVTVTGVAEQRQPAPDSDPTEPTPQNALAAIAARVAALYLDGPPLIVAGELDRARQQAQYLVTQGRLSQDATRLVVSEIIGRGYRVAEPLAAAAGLELRVGSYEPSADRWTLAGPEGGEAFRGGQLAALIRRIAALGYAAGAPPAEEVVPEAPAENVATLARDAIAAAMDCMIARRPGDIDVDALDHLQDRLIVLSAAEAGTFSELIAVVVEYAETSR